MHLYNAYFVTCFPNILWWLMLMMNTYIVWPHLLAISSSYVQYWFFNSRCLYMDGLTCIGKAMDQYLWPRDLRFGLLSWGAWCVGGLGFVSQLGTMQELLIYVCRKLAMYSHSNYFYFFNYTACESILLSIIIIDRCYPMWIYDIAVFKSTFTIKYAYDYYKCAEHYSRDIILYGHSQPHLKSTIWINMLCAHWWG